MRWRMIALLVVAVAGAACDALVGSQDRVTEIGWGSSFGMCTGYCQQDLVVTPTEVRLTQTSWTPQQFPQLVSTLPLTGQSSWPILRAALDSSGFLGLQHTYGCPDCTDGGAEWVEVAYGGLRRRVTFEYGNTPQPLAVTVTYLRAIHDTFFPRIWNSYAPSAAEAGR